MDKIFDIAAKVSTPVGLSGITLAALLLICREIIRKEIFPNLTKNLSAEILKLLIHRFFVLALVSMLLGFAGFALTLILGQTTAEVPKVPEQARVIQYAGQVVDIKGNPVFGAIVQIRDEHGDIQVARTDSTGRYQYTLRSAAGTAHYKVSSDRHEPYERDLSPDRTAGEPFILQPRSPTASPTKLDSLNLDHDLLGVELSFTPSQEMWDRIAAAYRRMKSPSEDLSYVDVPMTAERDGDHWRVDFEATQVKERVIQTPSGPMRLGGYTKFQKVSTADPNNRGFEDVLNEALPGLRIEWGNGSNTPLEPRTEDYPSAIYVSRDKIALTLRPPRVSLNLTELREHPTVKFYGRNYPVGLPPVFRIRSLDPAAELDQTIQLEWKRREPNTDYDSMMNRQVSGPHRLSIALRFVRTNEDNPRR
jgi:hypothetical protein